jgi:hypothetical protein
MQSTLRPPNTLAEPHSPPYAPNPSPIHEANEFHPIEYQPQTPPYGPSPIQDISGATIG